MAEPRRHRVRLAQTSNGDYEPGRGLVTRLAWLLVEAVIFLNPAVTSYGLKRRLLRAFGAQIGDGLVIKPGVHIKHPWRLRLGDHVWLGERAWIDNLVQVDVGDDVCISQGAYLCTGNHDWSDPGMRLFARPIVVEPGAWIGAAARVAPGVTVGREAVLSLGAVLFTDAQPGHVYAGNPAAPVGERRIGNSPSSGNSPHPATATDYDHPPGPHVAAAGATALDDNGRSHHG